MSATVAALTEKIQKAPSADLYFQRAIEFRALREKGHAISDLRAALKLQPHQLSMAALAELLSDRGEHAEAQQLGSRLLKLDPSSENHLLLARISLAAGDRPAALRHVQQGPAAKDDTHLLHAYLLGEEGEHEKAAQILKAAHQITKSIVLRNAWLDSAISAGQRDQVLPILNREIETSRFTASHRIRRARLLLKSDPEAAQADLKFALEELQPRIKATRPDLTLIYDRGLTLVLTGDREAAKRDLAILQASSLSPLSYALLTREFQQ